MEKLKCLRCNYEWYKRTPKDPKCCPACKSRVWDQGRKKSEKVD
jgi:predicted Zn-ribbon and HTH transcriptional regulator